MFFIISMNSNRFNRVYRLYDNKTDSYFSLLASNLEKMVGSKDIEIYNSEVLKSQYNGNIYYDNIDTYYVLVSITDGCRYKMLSNYGYIENCTKEEVIMLTKQGLVDNCRFNTGNLTIECISEVEIIETDTEFTRYIADENVKYNIKSKLLGFPSKLSILVEGHNVVLVEFDGNSDKIVLPEFIVSIDKEVFRQLDTGTIKLNNGLKYIGKHAFANCNIRQIVLPDTLKYVYGSAFYGNDRLYLNDESKIIDYSKVIVKGNTIII